MDKATEILRTHKITKKTTVNPNGVPWTGYSIQFTYPKGKKRQFSGKSEEEVKKKVYDFFGLACITYKELCTKWTTDLEVFPDLRKGRLEYYNVNSFIPFFGDKIAADITSDDILSAAKKLVARGNKTNGVNTKVRSVIKMYEYAIQKKIAGSNPAAGVKRFHAQETKFERNYLTDRQIFDFLNECRKRGKYVYPVFLICGIKLDFFLPLRWKDIDFESHKIDITRRMKSRMEFEIVNLERMERMSLEVPKMAFDYLEMELNRQAERCSIDKEILRRSDRFITTHNETDHNTKGSAFYNKLYHFIRDDIEAPYQAGDIFFTSAVYAFKAGCDMQSVAGIVGYPKAIEMFRHPENYDVFERKTTKNVNDYFDELYFNSGSPLDYE